MTRRLVFALAMMCVARAAAADPAPAFVPLVDDHLQLLITPSADGHAPFIRAIDAATTTIDMTMFHLTDTEVVDALVRAAGRGVTVRVIVDGTGLKPRANRAAFTALAAGGVDTRPSSAAFSITHAKAMVIDAATDHAVAFITAINLTRDAARTRDLGVITHAPTVTAELEHVFAADWTNATTGGHVTPQLAEPSLVVSPISARAKLTALIASAQHDLIVTVENLGDAKLDAAFAAAARRGVAIRMIVPLCDKNPDPLYNLPAARALAGVGADVRLMPAPETADTPYMHSKMILVDGAVAYVGSINFSANSLGKARELGVIFANADASAQIRATFDADWAHVVPLPTGRARCAKSTE